MKKRKRIALFPCFSSLFKITFTHRVWRCAAARTCMLRRRHGSGSTHLGFGEAMLQVCLPAYQWHQAGLTVSGSRTWPLGPQLPDQTPTPLQTAAQAAGHLASASHRWLQQAHANAALSNCAAGLADTPRGCRCRLGTKLRQRRAGTFGAAFRARLLSDSSAYLNVLLAS